MLCYTYRLKMQLLFRNALGNGLIEVTRKGLIGFMTAVKFREYAAKMRETKLGKGRGLGWERSIP